MTRVNHNSYNVIIIGGGFYGCVIALHFRKFYKKIAVIESENDLLNRASYCNQARVHNGYHYPRNFLTALSSHLNYPIFIKKFSKAIVNNYKIIYAIARKNSKTSTSQFIEFCKQVGCPILRVSDQITSFFNDDLIESVFEVEESVFDTLAIKQILKENLTKQKVNVLLGSNVIKVEPVKETRVKVILANDEFVADRVVCAAYSGINILLKNSRLPIIPFKHELIELPLLEVPDSLASFGITIMDGPFFGVMPFPSKNLHTLHHVRYSPRENWTDDKNKTARHINFNKYSNNSKFPFMIKDAQRYIPILKDSIYVDSLYETRTVLVQNETNDGRPILFKDNYGINNFSVVMGGKIDNIYDVLSKIHV